MAAPSPSPRRSFAFPPEVLLQILSFISDSYYGQHHIDSEDRNAGLASLSLVNRAFQEATYSVLYGDLRLAWMADKVKKLRKSFSCNPNLLPLIRRLEATAVHRGEWIEYQLENPSEYADAWKQAWFKAYCEREGIVEDSHDWLRMMEDGLEDSSAGDARAEDMWSDAEDAWARRGHGQWEGFRNLEGALELLDIIASTPALRTLVVREFADTLQEPDIAKRGPYPIIESLEVTGSCPSPFFLARNLPSLLASATPNLRSLSGYNGHLSRAAPAIFLPLSLTRLEIMNYKKMDPRIDTLLLQVQPSLRSLTLSPSTFDWASSPTLVTLLTSLETLTIANNLHYSHDKDINNLARAIAPSSSLRHLGLVPATAALIAALPPSLLSITLLPTKTESGAPRFEMEQVLGLLKAATTQPLRVEFAKKYEWQGWLGWEECRDMYEAEGHTLSVQCYYAHF
ncbi:hypothetical protein RQP46_004139 [Phenoliferia psychrophenolica]